MKKKLRLQQRPELFTWAKRKEEGEKQRGLKRKWKIIESERDFQENYGKFSELLSLVTKVG